MRHGVVVQLLAAFVASFIAVVIGFFRRKKYDSYYAVARTKKRQVFSRARKTPWDVLTADNTSVRRDTL